MTRSGLARLDSPSQNEDRHARRSTSSCKSESAGRLGEAIPLYEQTLADSAQVLGPDHPQTLNSRNSLEKARAKSPRQ
jgi:hypothetical protein